MLVASCPSCYSRLVPYAKRFSLRFLLPAACAALLALSPHCFAQQTEGDVPAASASNAVPAAATYSALQAIPNEPHALYQALNDLRPDAERVYSVHQLSFRRDIISFTFTEGKLAFLQPLGGRITGAVFTGRGHVLATPRDRGERRSLAQYLGVPILEQSFSRAYLRFTDETAAEIEAQLESGEGKPESGADFAGAWNTIAGRLAPPHSLRIMLDVLSENPLPYFYALLQSDSVGAFDVLVDDRREEQVLIGQPRVTNGIPTYDVWASFRAQNAPAVPIEIFAPLDYRVDSTIANDLSVEGKTTLHLTVLRGGERVIPLELSRKLGVEEVHLEDGRPLAYFQNEDLGRRDILRKGNDAVLVVLPAPAPAGEQFRVQVSYRGSVITDAGNGVEFVGEHETWYAHTGGGEHFVPFDLAFRWPKRFTLVATGAKIESHEDGDSKTGRWRSDVPFSVAGFNLGEYKTESAGERPRIQVYANQQLEDAIVARLAQKTPPAPSLPSILEAPPSQMQVAIAPPLSTPSPAAVLKSLGAEVLDSIHFYEKLNGAFPFDHLDVAQIPGSFGQGWPGLVYLSTLAFLPPEAQERAGLGEWAQGEARDLMPFHEVAHQWWGNLVGATSYRDTWIQEGLANYLSLLYADSKKPGNHRLAAWLEHYRANLIAKSPGSTEIVDEFGPLSLGVRLASSKSPDAYNTIIYGKGTWVIHMLREMLRDPGAKDDPDARFRKLLDSTLTDYRFHGLSTADFEHEVERQMTPAMDLEGTHRMDWFFDEWVRQTGIPHYTVKFEVKPRGTEFLVTGRLEQNGVDDVFTAAVPLYAARQGSKLENLGVVITTGPETRFHFVSRTRPTRIVIDPHLTLLCRTD